MTDVLASLIVASAFTAIALAVTRLLRGPARADRVVALDVILSSSIALCAAATLAKGEELYLDVAIGLSVTGFVATLLWARLIDASAPGRATSDEVRRSPRIHPSTHRTRPES